MMERTNCDPVGRDPEISQVNVADLFYEHCDDQMVNAETAT